MKPALLLLPMSIVFLTGCSVYKSATRNNFESQSPSRVIAGQSLTKCSLQDAMTAWMLRQSPGAPAELLMAEDGVEIWRHHHGDGTTSLRSYRATATGIEVCAAPETSL